jgi:hypothetical protein
MPAPRPIAPPKPTIVNIPPSVAQTCNIDDIVSAKMFYDKANVKKAMFTHDKSTKITYITGAKNKKTCSVTFNNTDLINGKKSFISKRFNYNYAGGKWLPVDYN